MSSRKGMGRAGATAYVVSSIIGAGIFIMPATVVNNVHSMGAALIVWATAGLIAALGAFCYMELGTRIRRSGGDFAYLCHIGWHPIAFAHAICSVLIIQPGSIAIQTGTFAEYLVKGLQLQFCDQFHQMLFQKLVAINLIFALFLINWFSMRTVVVPFQMLAMGAKVLACGTVIVVGALIWMIKGPNPDNFLDPFANTSSDPGNWVLAMFGAMLAFGGWEILNVGMEDVHNPKRTMPFAYIFGISAVAIFYISMNLAYFVVLSVPELQKSNAIAMTFAEQSFGGPLQYAMPFLICIQLIGTLNAAFFGHSRFAWAISRQGLFPSFIACIDPKNGSPRAALFVHMIMAIVMVSTGSIQQLISTVLFTDQLIKSMSMLVLLRLKLCQARIQPVKTVYLRPKTDSVIHVPIVLPLAFLGVCLSLACITVVRNFALAFLGLLALGAGLCCYALFIGRWGLARFELYRIALGHIDYCTSAIAQFIFGGSIDLSRHNEK